MEPVLAILDTDERYVRRLSAAMEKQQKIPFRIMGFSKAEAAMEYAMTQKISFLLVEEGCWEESKTYFPLRHLNEIILLVKERSREEEVFETEEGAIHAICKYQSGEDIVNKILKICLEYGDEKAIASALTGSGHHARVIGIYTPIGRCLQTSFSLMYCKLMAVEHKVLYMNFEVFAGFREWFQREYKTDLMDLMYYLDDSREKFLLKLASLSERFDGFSYIPPALSFEDFTHVEEEQWIELIRLVAESGEYEVLVLDLGDQMRGLIRILERCDKVYTLARGDALSKMKLNDFEDALRLSGRESVIAKMTKCQLPIFQDMSQKAEQLPYTQLAEYMKKNLAEDFRKDSA
ncbi:MAG: hypothetical protein K6G07_02745 [Lachnospiraceae bacterium]|nr:hypothetical protein [Lachnospiraceae bacterium]